MTAAFDLPQRLVAAVDDLVPQALLRSRAAVREVLAALRDIDDGVLERVWVWREGELDVRYGLYRPYEVFEDARARVRELMAATAAETSARALTAAASAARWSLHGVLANLDDKDLDRDPGNGEWTVRQTLAHIVGGQRGYAWYTSWWLEHGANQGGEYPAGVPDGTFDLPEEETEAEGTLSDIGRRLDEIVDLSTNAFAGLSAEQLQLRSRWSGRPVDVRFRLGRWSSHIREHTIQVEKTLGFIGRQVTEVDRLQRLVADAYGRLEEELFPPPASSNLAESLAIVQSAASGVLAVTHSVAQAARTA